MGAAIAKIAFAGAYVQTSVPLVSLVYLAEGEHTVDFDTLLGEWIYCFKPVGIFALTE